jgi:endonuclease/exonuclease/phosphatase family metal-dependent hydrolase
MGSSTSSASRSISLAVAQRSCCCRKWTRAVAAMDYQGGAYGLAILSKHPVTRPMVHPLPGADEPRILMTADVALPGGKARVAVAHLEHTSSAARLLQTAEIARLLPAKDGAFILGGDFNDGLESGIFASITAAGWTVLPKTDARKGTIAEDREDAEIDHLFTAGVRGPSRILDTGIASDHVGVIADVPGK